MKLLEECLSQTGWPGVTGAIVYPNGSELAVAGGFSDREAPRAMEPRDRMLAGSVGKTFAAVAALSLVEDGRMGLDESITRFQDKLPWISTLPQARELTLRRVLAHRTGIVDFIYTDGWRARWAETVAKNPNHAQSVEEGIAIAAAEPPSCAPDTETRYADTNYLIIGRLVEAASGQDYYAYLHDRVLAPLALRATSPSNVRHLPGLVPGYLREGLVPFWGPKTLGADGLLVYNPSWEFTGGGLVSTSADLARFMKVLFEGRLIGSTMLAEMQVGWPMEMPTLPNHRYGLGIQMFDSTFGPVVGHSGQFAGYRTLAFYFKSSGVAVALQTNVDVDGLLPTFLRLAAYAHESGKPDTGG